MFGPQKWRKLLYLMDFSGGQQEGSAATSSLLKSHGADDPSDRQITEMRP
jgi:hypothetical protein